MDTRTLQRRVNEAKASLEDLKDHFSGLTLARPSRGVPTPAGLRTEQALTPREAFYAKTESVPLATAEGRVAAEFVTPYPPGIPLA